MKALLLSLALQGLPAPPPEPIPVLIVSGANNHDWEWTTPSLERILTESGRFDVTVTRSPRETFTNREALSAFEAIVLDYNGPAWGEPAQSNFLYHVRQGTGVVVVHAANNAFPGWIEYEKLVALCWREGTGHGSFHPFDVDIIDRDHPLTRTLPRLIGHPDELYHRLVHMHGTDFRTLGTALSSKESGGTGEAEPMIVVKRYGRGRVFHTPLGHVWRDRPETHASHLDAQFATLIVRGTEWAATGEVSDGDADPNRLEPWDEKAGWRLLFDGQTTEGWRRHGGEAFPEEGWEVINGALRHIPNAGGGDIVAEGTWEDFELEFEWKVGGTANSGVKYRVAEAKKPAAMLGPEYQILDDHGASTGAKHSAAALYDVVAPRAKTLARVGEWNRARILAEGDRIEHWLNGERVLDVHTSSTEGFAAVAASKFRGNPRFLVSRPGLIGLQDHGGEAWYRSIRLRDRANMPGEETPLFDGHSVEGWTQVGDADWYVEDGVLHGEVGGGAQSFLVSEETYADFFLELELKIEAGNSGVQVRSHVTDGGRLYGYQLEVDSGGRAWSGGLFDEGRRGWLQSLADNPRGRAALDRHGWNHYRIECVGPSIRCWVNGIPTADYIDTVDAEGHIALQVHNGSDTELAWRNIKLVVLQ